MGYNSLPAGYIPYNNQDQSPKIIFFTEAERQAIDPNLDADIYRNINPAFYIDERWAPSWLFNAKLTKEFRSGVSFSFYANNFINDRPLRASTRYPNQFYKRNIAFFFGSELSIKL